MTKTSANNSTHYPTLSINWELYSTMLDESDLSDKEKKEFIQILWNIVVTFVDLGFGTEPVQQICEQNDTNTAQVPHDLVHSYMSDKTRKHSTTVPCFNNATAENKES